MNPTGHNRSGAGPDARLPDAGLRGAGLPDAVSYEGTLYVLTHVGVPEGLEERVHAALRATPEHARTLAWPRLTLPHFSYIEGGWAAGWTRAAAAAAIVFVVAGGGWGVYRRAQHQPARAIMVPASVAAPAADGFSSAGAMRVPATVKGPAVAQAPARKTAKKPAAHKAKPAAAAQPIAVPAGR